MKDERKVGRRLLNHGQHPGKYALLCCFKEEPGELVAEGLLKRGLQCSFVSTITFENCLLILLFIHSIYQVIIEHLLFPRYRIWCWRFRESKIGVYGLLKRTSAFKMEVLRQPYPLLSEIIPKQQGKCETEGQTSPLLRKYYQVQ